VHVSFDHRHPTAGGLVVLLDTVKEKFGYDAAGWKGKCFDNVNWRVCLTHY